MPPELVSFVILASAGIVVGLLMLADQLGWRSPLPRLELDRRWVVLIWTLMVVLAALQVLRIWSLL